MPDEEYWDALERYSGEIVSRTDRKQGDEIAVVDLYLDSIGHSLPGGVTKPNPADPPDVLSTFQGSPIAAEVARIVNGDAIKATKALHKGQNVPGYSHPEGLNPLEQRFVWSLSETVLRTEIRALVAKKSAALEDWKLQEASQRWLLLELRDGDHNCGIDEVEKWIENCDLPVTGFDRIGVVTWDYDPRIQLPRSVTLKS